MTSRRSARRLTVKQLLAIVRALPERAAFTDAAFRRNSTNDLAAKAAWIGWVSEYDGPG